MRILIALTFLLITQVSFAQSNTLISAELQVYPTGIIPGLSADIPVSNTAYAHVRLGANIFDHRDLGEQDKEEGSGFGFSLGYRQFFGEQSPWRWGIKNDVWFNTVDWENDVNGTTETGTTDIIVIQPTGEIGYAFQFSKFVIVPSIAFGLEWNVKTDGEPTGEGPILLAGIQLGRKF